MKELLYALPAGMKSAGARWGLVPAHMAYQVVPGPKLVGVALTPEIQGGAMLIACGGEIGEGDPAPCCRQVQSECRKRGFDRVICDLEGDTRDGLGAFLEALAGSCAQGGVPLYLPEQFARFAPDCRVLVSSVVVSGTLERKLSGAMERYGAERVALAVEAAAEDFLLPASGRGEPMTAGQLQALINQVEPAVFFDRGLCAHYFTYMARGSHAHFILYDTPRSVREKLDVAQRLGVPSALLAAPQVEGWLPEIFS